MISQNKNSSKKVYALYLAVAFFFTAFSFGKTAHAENLFIQPDASVEMNIVPSGGGNSGTAIYYPNGNNPIGFTGQLKYITVKYADGNAAQSYFAEGGSHNPGSWAGFATCSVPWSGQSCSGTADFGGMTNTIAYDGDYVTFEVSGTFNVTSGQYMRYNLKYDETGSHDRLQYMGDDSGTCEILSFDLTNSCTGTYDLGLTKAFIVLSGTGGFVPPEPPETHIISLTPSEFSSTTSPFAFHFNFYNSSDNPVLNACVTLYDEAIGGPPGFKWREGCSALSFLPDATIDFSQYFSAYPTGDWAMVGEIFDQNGTLIEATTTRFFVTSDSSGYQNFIPSQDYATTTGFTIPQFTDSTVGTSTLLDTTNFLSFLNVPQLLKTKVPFSYIFQIGDAIDSGLSSSTALEIPSGTFEVELPLGTHGTTTLEVDMFSTTTITYFLNDTAISSLRGLMAAITYIGMGMFIFFDARSKKYLI